MKREMDKWDRELLRAESGELPERRLRRLHAAMERDPALKARHQEWSVIRQTLRDAETAPMEAAVRQRIMAAARRAQPAAPRPFVLFPLRPMTVAASLLLLAAGLWIATWLYRAPPSRPITAQVAEIPLYWGDEYLDWEISLLSEEVRGIFSELLADLDLETDALAAELLRAEGLQI